MSLHVNACKPYNSVKGQINTTVDEVIAALRERFEVETDADLARKLRIDKSTVSSWRARGKVPQRFHSILDGEPAQFIAAPPLKWGEHEREAFDLALFRFGRLIAKAMPIVDYRTALELFHEEAQTVFWLLMDDAQKDLATRQNGQTPKTSLALNLYDDIEAGDAAVDRDRERLAKRLRSGFRLAGTE